MTAPGYMPEQRPILYSFRRCPYAMRARLALGVAKIPCELREVVLRDKPAEMIAASAKATVPVLITPNGRVIDESLDIMRWALAQNDPGDWLRPAIKRPQEMHDLIARADGGFKASLDIYKYASRHPTSDALAMRDTAGEFLLSLNALLVQHTFLFGADMTLADMAILPFVRQFANVDPVWFESQPWSALKSWLDHFLYSPEFAAVMLKYPKWQVGNPVTIFPESGQDAS